MTRPRDALDALPVQSAKSRILITLVVDTSSSMGERDRIGQLNRALAAWRSELMRDAHVSAQGEIALVTFGADHVRAVDPSGRTTGPATEPYVPVSQFSPPPLAAGGVTPMVEGLNYAFELLAARRQQLRRAGIQLSSRPMVYLITDGVPTDSSGRRSDQWRDLAPGIRQQENGKHLLFFALGVDNADQTVLEGLAPHSWHYLANLNFSEILKLVSASIEAAASASARSESAQEVYANVNQQPSKAERINIFLNGD